MSLGKFGLRMSAVTGREPESATISSLDRGMFCRERKCSELFVCSKHFYKKPATFFAPPLDTVKTACLKSALAVPEFTRTRTSRVL
jgi:hypothetical protein